MSKLVLVPTPIGNLEDMTLRALDALRRADVVAAEDTRHSGKLLAHFGIDKPLVRLDAHTIAERGESVLAGNDLIAYLSDAGTPGISDPGAELVTLALARGDKVDVLPGATAIIPALVLSGLPLGRFAFEGFLPRKGSARRERLESIATSERTVALYESPKRIVATLGDLIDVCGPARGASISREITKLHEETLRGTLADLKAKLQEREVRGEIVLVVAPAPQSDDEPEDYAVKARQLAAEGLTGKSLRKALTALGAPRNLAYELTLQYKHKE